MSVNDSSSISGELSLSFSVSSVEESDLGTVERYQIEPEASDSPASARGENDYSGDEERFRGRDW